MEVRVADPVVVRSAGMVPPDRWYKKQEPFCSDSAIGDPVLCVSLATDPTCSESSSSTRPGGRVASARRLRRWTGLALVTMALAATSVVPASARSTEQVATTVARSTAVQAEATNYLQNPQHDGLALGAPLRSTMKRAWQVRLDDHVSYAVTAGGRVFVATATGDAYGGSVYALDARTGRRVWGPVALGGYWQVASLAFDSGKLLTLNAAGRVRALSPATGVQLWSAQLPQELTYVEPPTAVSGRLFVVGDGNQSTTFALNVATGRVLWTNTADPARGAVVGGGKVYLAGGLDRARALTRNGAALWDTIYCCLVPLTPVLHGNTLWVRDWADATYALSTSGGAVKFTLPFSAPPAVSGDRALLTTSDGVAAYSASTGRRLWLQPAVTGSAPPVISGNIAYVGTRTFKGTVYGLDLATGAVVWTGATGLPIELDEYNAVLKSSLAVGGGMLLVPSGGTLTAFR